MNDPARVAAAAASAPRPLLVGVDVDGTLSPLVVHPRDSRLATGGRNALNRLAAAADVTVAVVSGRPLQELRDQFGFDEHTRLVGSHGLQDSLAPPLKLDAGERQRFDDMREELLAVSALLPGAWVEDKPVSVVLHVRQAEEAAGDAALAALTTRLSDRTGVFLIGGHRVLEVAVRRASKAAAVERLRAEAGARAVVYVGDDVSDEEVLASLRPTDIGVRVGGGDSVAAYRLEGPTQVVAMLNELVSLLGP